ncbi:MAG: c-type cytochrome [Cytophagales bacterium]|nr:c-type cytochrome [Cytophagales bacterium]
MRKAIHKTLVIAFVAALIVGCTAKGEDPGTEFSPQMYHSTAYEPLSQVVDESQGDWLDSNPEDGHGEFYNSNPYNAHGMTMREPVEGTVRRGKYLPYRIAKDSVAQAAGLINPYEGNPDIIPQGKALYDRFCDHCHGANGEGDGLVGKVLLGIPKYNVGATKELPAGHIFHVITHGIRRMGAHGSQLSEDERWKIVSYVQTLQNQ